MIEQSVRRRAVSRSMHDQPTLVPADADNTNQAKAAGAYAPAAFDGGGTLEHPEELTDRCCLSALAGLSKYLPLLGAGDIIAFWSDMSTLGLVVLHTL